MTTVQKTKDHISQTGWITTDEEEIAKRCLRGRTEALNISNTEPENDPFSLYRVSSNNASYQVEIRSLNEQINSCDCPDFQTNNLGTCKHIEGVLHRCNKKNRTSPFAEIFLSLHENPQVRIVWPEKSERLAELKTLLFPYFSENGALLASNAAAGVASLQNTVEHASKELRQMVRFSQLLTRWIEIEKRAGLHQLGKEQFLADVNAGKRSLQMVSVPLYPYQEAGMLHLAFQGRAILADDMGLGKTVQAIAAAELLRRLCNIQRVLIVCPASLKGEWEEQIAKFSTLSSQIIHGLRPDRLAAYRKSCFFYIANYEQVRSDLDEMQQMIAPDLLILDEAQRIKNWKTQTAATIKRLQTPYVFVLTGTPIENRIDDIYSLMQIVNPRLFGSLFRFNRQFYKLDEKGKAIGYKNLEALHRLLRPVLLRRLKKDVEEQLPERTVNNFFVKMTGEQSIRYDDYNGRVASLLRILKKRPLTDDESKQLQQHLACMRMIVDTPYILDPDCKDCPKLEELKEILTEILQTRDAKIIIFSEWERMLFLIKEMLEEKDIPFAWHTGSVSQDRRREEIRRFKEDPECRCFLTTDAGSTGLNLQVANTVINMDLPWNPAKLEQRIARAWRKHQTRAVQVINFVCEDSIEHRMLDTLAQKQQLITGVLDGHLESDEILLPSGRAAFIKRLEELTDESFALSQSFLPVTAADQVKTAADDLLAQFTDRIHLMQLYSNPSAPQKTLFAVVDQCTPETQSRMKEILHKNFSDSPPVLAILDPSTLATIRQLAQNGVLMFCEGAAELLYQSPHYGTAQNTRWQQCIRDAKQHQAVADRKIAMAMLLSSGQFHLEAVPPTQEAIAAGIKILNSLKISPSSDLIELQSELARASTTHHARILVSAARAQLEKISELLAKHALAQVAQLTS